MAAQDPHDPKAWPSPWPYDLPPDREPAAAKPSPIVGADGPLEITRRSLFSAPVLGWTAFVAAAGLGTLGVVRFFFPNASFEAPQRFLTRPKEAFAPETVDETWKESNGVWMVHTGGKLVAVSTVCTHLGCTPDWRPGERKFKCPCHGSGFYIDGVNFEGPAPRPLERYRIFEDPISGMVGVDKTVMCRQEQGACEAPGFSIPMPA